MSIAARQRRSASQRDRVWNAEQAAVAVAAGALELLSTIYADVAEAIQCGKPARDWTANLKAYVKSLDAVLKVGHPGPAAVEGIAAVAMWVDATLEGSSDAERLHRLAGTERVRAEQREEFTGMMVDPSRRLGLRVPQQFHPLNFSV